MKTKKGLLRGSKISSRHSTVIADAVDIIESAKNSNLVSKVVLGKITVVRSGRPRLKCMDERAGLRVLVRGSITCQVLHIYTYNKEQCRQLLFDVWEKKY